MSFARRLALLATAAGKSSWAPAAFAQIPVFSAEPARATEPAPAAEPAPATEPLPATGTASGSEHHSLPPPPPAPATTASRVSRDRPAGQPLAPAPAKADHIAAQGTSTLRPAEEHAAPDESLHEDGRPRRRWYGWQTLIADGSSTLLIVGAALNQDDTVVTAALLGYEFAPGIIHFAHRNTGRGFASMALRLGMPLGGAFLGAAVASSCDSNDCELGGAALGALLGIGGAIAIDAAVFAYDDPRPSTSAARVVPLLAVSRGQAWLGVGGRL